MVWDQASFFPPFPRTLLVEEFAQFSSALALVCQKNDARNQRLIRGERTYYWDMTWHVAHLVNNSWSVSQVQHGYDEDSTPILYDVSPNAVMIPRSAKDPKNMLPPALPLRPPPLTTPNPQPRNFQAKSSKPTAAVQSCTTANATFSLSESDAGLGWSCALGTGQKDTTDHQVAKSTKETYHITACMGRAASGVQCHYPT